MSTMRFAGTAIGINRIFLRRRAVFVSSGGFNLINGAIIDNGGSSSSSSINHYSSTPSLLKMRPKFQRAGEGKLENSKRIHELKRKIKNLEGVGAGKIASANTKNKGQIYTVVKQAQPKSEKNKKQHLPKPKLDKEPYNKPTYTRPLRGPFSVFISCLPGLEPLLLQEVTYLQNQWQQFSPAEKSKSKPKAVRGGVKVILPALDHIYVLHLYLGTASHIYLRLNDDKAPGIPPLFRARGFPELQRKLKDLIISQQWDQLLDIHSSSSSKKKKSNARRDASGAYTETSNKKREESSLPWELQVHVTTSKSKLMHTKAVEERVRETIGEVLGIQGLEKGKNTDEGKDTGAKKTDKNGKERPMVRLYVRIDRDEVQLSLDTSSSSSAIPLHMRGYRLDPFKAPLREDLAFALLMAGGLKTDWNLKPLQYLLAKGDHLENSVSVDDADDTTDNPFPEEAVSLQLFDPLCGSGTIAIEGASILAGLPPGRLRSPPLQGTKLCRPKLWNDMKSKVMNMQSSKRSVDTISTEESEHDNDESNSILVAANDINKQAIDAAQSNAKRAGVEQFIDFKVGSFKIHPLLTPLRKKSTSMFEVSDSQPLTVVTNPPYGKRLGDAKSSPSIYKQIAKALSSSPYKTQYALIGKDPRSLRGSALPLDVAFSTKHGGLSVVAMSGTLNKEKPKVSLQPLEEDVDTDVDTNSDLK